VSCFLDCSVCWAGLARDLTITGGEAQRLADDSGHTPCFVSVPASFGGWALAETARYAAPMPGRKRKLAAKTAELAPEAGEDSESTSLVGSADASASTAAGVAHTEQQEMPSGGLHESFLESIPPAASFLEELAWVESLASPSYVAYLCQMRRFDDVVAQRRLTTLQRWRQDPAYRQHVSQPIALFFLEQLCSAEFREALRHPAVAALYERQVDLYRRCYGNLLNTGESRVLR
jgi:hypothetical protein